MYAEIKKVGTTNIHQHNFHPAVGDLIGPLAPHLHY